MGLESWPSLWVFSLELVLLLTLLPAACKAEFSVSDLFMNTLRTYFVFACEDEFLTVRCPAGTIIRLQNANYGRRVPSADMCPLPWTAIGTQQYSLEHEDLNCKAADSLQILLARCEELPLCRIEVKSSLFSEDPCPSTHKYLDVSYKCIPQHQQFIRVETCEDSHMNIYCKGTNQVIAVHSAHFGRLLPGSMTCPSYTMQELECQTDDALEQTMRRCHGKRHCVVRAGTKVYGDPCPADMRKYLVVLYACASKSIFRKPRRFPGLPPMPSSRGPGASSNGNGVVETGIGNGPPGPPFRTVHPSFSDSSFSSSSGSYNETLESSFPNSTARAPNGSSSKDSSSGIADFVNSIMLFIEFVKENKHIFIQYFVIGCLVGVALALIAYVVQLKRKKAKLKKKLKGSDGTDSNHRANGVLASQREENRIDIDEIWRSPPPSSILEEGTPTEDDNDNTIWRSHTLPGRRQLNSYFP